MCLQSPRHEVLAIIPARGGSKGVPKKNIALLCGKPLIAYSIKAALASTLITRVIVSTEDEEIAAKAKACGAEVPFLRPRELAGDRSNLDDSFNYTLSKLQGEGYVPASVVYIFPTSPFRTPSFVDGMVHKLIDGHSAVVTAKRVSRAAPYYRIGSQDNVAKQVRIGKSTTDYFKLYNIFSGQNISGAPLGPYVHCIDDPVMLIDIDTHNDFKLAEMVIKEGLFDFGLN